MDQITIALDIATRAHAEQTDKAGRPYIDHPLAVAQNFTDATRYAVALLHDVIEDTDITLHDLEKQGISSTIIEAISAITKRSGEDYDDYLGRVKANIVARDVKLADLRHNMDLSRLQNPTEKDYQRVAKYKFALNFLTANC